MQKEQNGLESEKYKFAVVPILLLSRADESLLWWDHLAASVSCKTGGVKNSNKEGEIWKLWKQQRKTSGTVNLYFATVNSHDLSLLGKSSGQAGKLFSGCQKPKICNILITIPTIAYLLS